MGSEACRASLLLEHMHWECLRKEGAGVGVSGGGGVLVVGAGVNSKGL